MRNRPKRVTIKDIAQMAGVSKTTVSFAFNAPERISKDMYKKIMEIADKHGYIPNPVARTMTTNKIGTIGILLPQSIEIVLKNPYITEFMQGVGAFVTTRGFSITIVSPISGSLTNAVKIAVVDGFITVGLEEYMEAFEILHDRQVPFVTVDVPTSDDVPSVVSDDRNGCRMLMEKVLEFGHRDIAIIGVKPPVQYREDEHSLISENRMAGYNEALLKYDMSIDDISVYESHTTLEDGMRTAASIFTQDKKPTAILCMSDITALGVIDYCRISSIAVPDEVSVCGFDDISTSIYSNPKLTTISQNISEKGRSATEILFSVIEGKEINIHRSIPTQLVMRESLSVVKK
jgi:DNA-binding LacI/PurR family transcriptional regulator